MNEHLKIEFREAMSRLAGGVAVATTFIEGRPWGVTMTSCCSLSMDPPMILICVAKHNYATQFFIKCSTFGVNFLADSQTDVAEFASRKGNAKFMENHNAGEPKALRLKNAVAFVECTLDSAISAGDHYIVIGRVEEVGLGEAAKPLVYYSRDFYSVAICTM
ncbi:flavin reductase family protein [Allopusillimonas ginsengisoli]|uniref:flavin reductase family protein n=1 Tax=Allopusillimonas ginsengisoli TaxID=453575 RepID=UPI00102189EC|nr:flavin reductase family protein [Allopusillimonas ginsengisoli]TEA79661.1 flavin reductase [Allopusillimonas ginsengisoli]